MTHTLLVLDFGDHLLGEENVGRYSSCGRFGSFIFVDLLVLTSLFNYLYLLLLRLAFNLLLFLFRI